MRTLCKYGLSFFLVSCQRFDFETPKRQRVFQLSPYPPLSQSPQDLDVFVVASQVLDEALLVLLMPQGGVPEGIHDDLSRVPPFVCTALVQALREDILCEVEQVGAELLHRTQR